MPYELDHIFVCVCVGAPEAARIVSLGITEGRSNTHPGQGTSNRCFFFHNGMLELLWLHNEAEARSSATERTRLFERWTQRKTGACPFGLCFRSKDPLASAPFPGWDYTPRYMPTATSIHIAGNSDTLTEPMLFYIPGLARPDTWPATRRQPLQHAFGFREVTRLHWTHPGDAAFSPALAAVIDQGLLDVKSGPCHALEIGFDGEVNGNSISLTPELPLRFVW